MVARFALAAAFAPLSSCKDPDFVGQPSDWYYKSSHSCTGSDGPTTRKCKHDAKTWGCSGPSFCLAQDQATCKEIAQETTPKHPDGFSFMCPHLMLGTSELLAAAKKDKYDGTYGVVTIDSLGCGECVEILNDDPKNYPNAPTITAQVFNSVASQLDLYMAGGGMGANNACAQTKGKQPLVAMYNKYPNSENKEFLDHLVSIGYKNAAKIIDDVMLYSGGLRGGKHYAECVKRGHHKDEDSVEKFCQPPENGCDGKSTGICITDPDKACELAFQGKSEYVTNKSIESCKYAFNHDLHWNRPVSFRTVRCPKSLTDLTGLKEVYSEATELGSLVAVNESTRGKWEKSRTTTMEDCCEPTCGRTTATTWDGKKWEEGFDAIYTCNLLGDVYTEAKQAQPHPCRRRRSSKTKTTTLKPCPSGNPRPCRRRRSTTTKKLCPSGNPAPCRRRRTRQSHASTTGAHEVLV